MFTDERSVEVKVEEGHMKEEGKVRGPVSIVELDPGRACCGMRGEGEGGT